MSTHHPQALSLFDGPIFRAAVKDALMKMDPRSLIRNPVMFATAVAAVLCTIDFTRHLSGLIGQIAGWLWFTVLFANFAEAIAEGRGKAQAESLRRTRTETTARKVTSPEAVTWTDTPASQ